MAYYYFLYRLDANSITDSGAGMLADALKVNQSLQNLRLVIESSVYACRADSAEYWSYCIVSGILSSPV